MRSIKLVVMGTVVASVAAFAGAPHRGSAEAYIPSDAERARWTMSDMRSLATAIEAYAVDEKQYPSATTIEGLIAVIQPRYMRKAHATDAWGHAFLYVPADDRQSYRLVSAGSDGRTDASSWTAAGPLVSFDQDAVLEAGRTTRPWPFL